jgi:Domain of unknown function (DUF1905)/Bacteriocin-protection, YdeI or OmpD-Associated
MATFRAVIESNGKTATGIEVPAAVVEELGSGRRPKVRATVGGYAYRSSVAAMGGRYLLGVSADVRRAAGVAAGDEVEVTLEPDTDERRVAVPDDFSAALAAEPAAQAFFAGLSYSQQRWFVLGIEGAKQAETRERRIRQAVERLASGRGQR